MSDPMTDPIVPRTGHGWAARRNTVSEHIHTISRSAASAYTGVCCHECKSAWTGEDAIRHSLRYIDALEAENARLREQAEALATALEIAWAYLGSITIAPHLPSPAQYAWTTVDAALRAYREATQ